MRDDNLELGRREEIGRGHAYFVTTQAHVISCLSLRTGVLVVLIDLFTSVCSNEAHQCLAHSRHYRDLVKLRKDAV